jgi:pimeloyl-ACP methyl ester carboxylesterase
VQVALEAWRRMPARLCGLGFINGVGGRPFDTALSSRLARHLIPLLLLQMRRRARMVSRLSRVATAWEGLLPALIKLGLVGATIDVELFAQFAGSFAALDFKTYGRTMAALGKHDAWDVVPTVRVPAVIVAGDRDVFTPPAVARRMKALLPSARLRILEGATHYAPVEFREEVCAELAWLFAAAEEGA